MSQINDRNYVYSIIRTDLSIEDQIVQTAHSALEAGRELGTPNTHTHLILLEIKSQDAALLLTLTVWAVCKNWTRSFSHFDACDSEPRGVP